MKTNGIKKVLFICFALVLSICMFTAPIMTASFNNNNNNAYAVDSDIGDEDFDFGDIGDIGIDNNNDHGEINNLINNLDNQNANANNAANANANNANNANQPAGKNPATQKAIVDYSLKAAQGLNNMILDMIKNDGATDYPKYIIQMLRGASAAAATAYFQSPAAGAAVDGIWDMVLGWFHIGETSQSELQIMQSKLNDQFDRLSKEIDGVKRDISALSQKLDERIEDVMNKIDESFEAFYAKSQVTDFLYSTSGNFSYNLIRDYLYNAGQYSLYADLATALANNADDKTVNELYNKLYYALMHYDLASGEKSNLDKFTEYYIGDANRKSISHYYFEYLNSNQSYINENASYLAMNFASQVYFDYVSMLNIIRMINTYQLTEIYLNNSDVPSEELLNVKYYYGTGAYDYVTAGDIENLNTQLGILAENAYNQMLIDVEDILGLSKSYLVQEADGIKRYVTANNLGTFGNLVKDETIYLNQVITPYCNLFALDPTLFEYEFKSGEELLVENKKLGYYKVATNQNFTGTVIYDGTILYTIQFRVGDNTRFAGGSGTTTDPFVIATAQQYKLIYNQEKNDKSYLLVADIDFGGETINPLGSEISPFNGVFNGAGHKISNGKVDFRSENATSIFGVIGNSGVVKNLEINSFGITENKEHNAKKITAGIIAGINNGQIISCFINGSSIGVSRDSNVNSDNLNKAITMFVGAIAGENNGVITYSKVENTSVYAESKRFYSANKDSDNRNCVYAGGIVGSNNYGYIENCYVNSNVSVSTYGESTMDEGLSFRYPYITVQSGGIAGVVSTLQTIKNVYSEIKNENLIERCHVYNEAITGGSFYSHCVEYTDAYVPNQLFANLGAIKGKNSDVYKVSSNNKKIKYEFKTGENTGAVVDPEFECSTDLIYVGTDTKFKLDNLKLTLVINDGEKETEIDSCLSIIGLYGFNVYNPDKENDYKRQVTLNVYDSLNNSVYTINLGYIVKRNSIYKIELPNSYNNKFDYNSEINPSVYESLGINQIYATYYDGTVENVAEEVAFSVNTSALGLATGSLTYKNLKIDIDCFIECNLPYDQEEVTILQYIISNDKQTCTVVGYKTNYCSQCGKMEVENILKTYDIVIKNNSESTCSQAGYTGDLCILADGVVLTEDVILERGTYLPLKPHNFDYEHTNSIDFRDEHSHYCIDCHYQEAHMFRTIENENLVICECVVCNYETSLEINSRAKIEKLPRVVVSNSYAVSSTKEVKVFIDLHASTGITAANFSVNFDSALTLVSYKLGSILNGRDTIDSFKLYNDHINVTLVQSGTDYKTDGTILALVFKLPDELEILQKFKVEVTNKDNKDKFTDKNGNKTDFLSYAGGIMVVSHLPGDINGDDIINLVDTVILSNYITLDSHEQNAFVNEMLQNNPNFNISYGDVNLDGSIDISDVVQILRYTTGGYETTFVSNIFEVTLNYNDGTNRQDSIIVMYDHGKSKFGDIQPLPELQRIGQKFDGWYTDFGGKGMRISESTPVFYNSEQYKQTLYAHFIPNTITFDANGGEGKKLPQNYLSTIDLSNKYNDYYSYFTKETTVNYNGSGLVTNSSVTKTHTFLGWAISPDGSVVLGENDTLDLCASGYNGIGNLTLYAVWSNEILEPYKPTADGYTFLGWTGVDKNTTLWDGEENFVVKGDIVLNAKWRKNTFSFVYNCEGKPEHTETITRDIDNYLQPLWENQFQINGYSFMGWSLTQGEQNIDFEDNIVLTGEQFLNVINYIDNFGYVNLYAVWLGHSYSVSFDRNLVNATGSIDTIATRYGESFNLPSSKAFTPNSDEHKHFAGWSIYPNGSVVFQDGQTVSNITDQEGAEIILYAKWELDKIDIVYTISGNMICTDTVEYSASYTFKTSFAGLDGYAVEGYSIVEYTPGQHIDFWTDLRDIYIKVTLAYNGAYGLFTYTLYDDETATINGYNGESGVDLVIPYYIYDNSKLYKVIKIRDDAFASNNNRSLAFNKIIISNSVRVIGAGAFAKTKAESIYVSSEVETIYGSAFSNMSDVTNIILPTVNQYNLSYGTYFTNVFYLGTIQQWQNSPLRNDTSYENLYFYYSSGPYVFGYKYWTYQNGVLTIINY